MKLPFTEGMVSMALGSALAGSASTNLSQVQAVADSGDVLFAADPLDQLRQMRVLTLT